jgi:cell wall assembly regulator SMI1
MSIVEMNNSIITFTDKECGRGAELPEIANGEQILGVTFPESYRNFLSDVGWARFAHEQVFGIGSDVPAHLDLVRITLAERSEFEPRMPPHLIPIMNDGMGNHYCLDTSVMKNQECPVIFWDHEQTSKQIPERAADTFDAWLIDLLHDLGSEN